jgi:hypothetical protein
LLASFTPGVLSKKEKIHLNLTGEYSATKLFVQVLIVKDVRYVLKLSNKQPAALTKICGSAFMSAWQH